MTAYLCTVALPPSTSALVATTVPSLPSQISDADTFQMEAPGLTGVTWSVPGTVSPFQGNVGTSGTVPCGPYSFENTTGTEGFNISFSLTGDTSANVDITVDNGTGDD